jgi:hypothetical protein
MKKITYCKMDGFEKIRLVCVLMINRAPLCPKLCVCVLTIARREYDEPIECPWA